VGTPNGRITHGAFLFAAALTALSLAGCSSTTSDNREKPPPSPSATVSPTGRVTVGCDLSRPASKETPPPGPNDLIIGPLVYRGLANGYNFGNTPDADADGVTFFKIGAELPADSIATVSIDKAARRYAGILTEQGPSAGYSSVTYKGCSSQIQPGRVFWVGGFTLVGRQSACVPLDIQITGDTAPRHLMISIEAGSCKK
jgi:hypothetical protein